MKFTDRTKYALAARREERRMRELGYTKQETNWEIHRGFAWNLVILDARISCDGKFVYTKTGLPPAGEGGGGRGV